MVREESVERAERACLVELALSSLRHDLRNKLAAVRQASFYIRAKVQDTPAWTADARVQRFFDLIEDEVESANTILADESALSRIHPRVFTEVSVAEIVERAIRCSRHARAPSVEHEIAPGVWYGDPDELTLAVRCVIDNALEFAGDEDVRVAGGPKGALYEIRISDNGPGIPAEHRAHMRRPFESSRFDDMGVGLSIAQRIAQRYEGALDFEDGEEKFAVVMTLGRPIERRQILMARILLIDDDDVNRLTLGALLEDDGHQVVEAEGVAQACARLADGSFDAVLVDQHLPDGPGTSIIPRIRESSPKAHVLIVSGNAPRNTDGVDGYVLKGDGPERLLSLLSGLKGQGD